MRERALLLDTCAFLDLATGASMAPRVVRDLEAGAREGRLHLSPLSIQETLRLAERGRLDLRPTPHSWIQSALRRMQLVETPFSWEAAIEAGCLHGVNGDPVDRALLGTAIVGRLTLVTRDDDLLRAGKQKGLAVMDTRR